MSKDTIKPLESLERTLAFDPRDWGKTKEMLGFMA